MVSILLLRRLFVKGIIRHGWVRCRLRTKRMREIRQQCKFLVITGVCVTSGTVQVLNNRQEADEFVRSVDATLEYISTLRTSTTIADHVQVDFELRGCSISRH